MPSRPPSPGQGRAAGSSWGGGGAERYEQPPAPWGLPSEAIPCSGREGPRVGCRQGDAAARREMLRDGVVSTGAGVAAAALKMLLWVVVVVLMVLLRDAGDGPGRP